MRIITVILILFLSTLAFADERIADFTSEESLAILNENMRRLREDVDNSPRIFLKNAAPTKAPTRKGDIWIDSTAHKVYVSDGTTASTSWRILN